MTAFAQNLDKQLNRLGKEFQAVFNRFSTAESDYGVNTFSPDADVVEESGEIKILIDLPGMTKQDITLALVEGELRVEGNRPQPYGDETKFRQRERMDGAFSRTFNLPADTDANSIKAKFTNGVLQVTLSKTETRKPETSIPIE